MAIGKARKGKKSGARRMPSPAEMVLRFCCYSVVSLSSDYFTIVISSIRFWAPAYLSMTQRR